jgi:hypothetical protein
MRKNGGVPSRTFAWSRSVHAADGAVIVQVIGEGTFSGADFPGVKRKPPPCHSVAGDARCSRLMITAKSRVAPNIMTAIKPPFDQLAS